MGLFDFMKKNKVGTPVPPPPQGMLPPLGDLPPIDGSDLPPLESFNPPAHSEVNAKVQKPVGLPDLPALDFSLPAKEEDAPSKNFEPVRAQSLPSFPKFEPIQQAPVLQTQDVMQPKTSEIPANSGYVDLSEDLNNLFLADKQWSEPDWENYAPYTEPNIDPPQPADFGFLGGEKVVTSDESELPSFSPASRQQSDVPVDVFVKGKDYARVYAELDRINSLLENQEPKVFALFESVMKKEEDSLKRSKESMEYVYKKLMIIDKRIFG